MNAIEELTPDLHAQISQVCQGFEISPRKVELLERVLVLSLSEPPTQTVLESLGQGLKALGFRWVAMDLDFL